MKKHFMINLEESLIVFVKERDLNLSKFVTEALVRLKNNVNPDLERNKIQNEIDALNVKILKKKEMLEVIKPKGKAGSEQDEQHIADEVNSYLSILPRRFKERHQIYDLNSDQNGSTPKRLAV